MRKIKNWFWVAFLGIGGVLDFATDLLPEALKYFDIDQKYVNYLRFALFVFTLIKLKTELPTRNATKLKRKAKNLKNKEDGNGAVVPSKGF